MQSILTILAVVLPIATFSSKQIALLVRVSLSALSASWLFLLIYPETTFINPNNYDIKTVVGFIVSPESIHGLMFTAFFYAMFYFIIKRLLVGYLPDKILRLYGKSFASPASQRLVRAVAMKYSKLTFRFLVRVGYKPEAISEGEVNYYDIKNGLGTDISLLAHFSFIWFAFHLFKDPLLYVFFILFCIFSLIAVAVMPLVKIFFSDCIKSMNHEAFKMKLRECA